MNGQIEFIAREANKSRTEKPSKEEIQEEKTRVKFSKIYLYLYIKIIQ